MALTWTIAYRRVAPEAEPVFHRVDVAVTWQESVELAGDYLKALGDDRYEVWYVSTRASELAGLVQLEDILNVVVEFNGRTGPVTRVPIADDGLPLEALR